ncbi:MAG: phosphocholine cytidylyltransferase family protein [Bacteroidetes bacterium]|nr:phosphocholine cytidylyltransferase family protein [Bacteroidota bacterium]
MKAIILAAGIGSRIHPLTNNYPKALLQIGDKTILEMMLSHIQDCHINEIIFVTGYMEDQIKEYVKNKSGLKTSFVTNKKYTETNTGYSLMLAGRFAGNSDFIKFDADVVFEKEILNRLIDCPYENALCIDKNIHLDAEEIKVIVDTENKILKASKTVDPKKAIGESIGIEKIGEKTAILLFQELELMMKDKNNHQEYYETAYERLINKGASFHALDITGLKWIEIDTKEDYDRAKNMQSV